jgi:hypothetical protein
MFLLPDVMRMHAILLRRHARKRLIGARLCACLPVLSGRDQVTARCTGGYFQSQLRIPQHTISRQ